MNLAKLDPTTLLLSSPTMVAATSALEGLTVSTVLMASMASAASTASMASTASTTSMRYNISQDNNRVA